MCKYICISPIFLFSYVFPAYGIKMRSIHYYFHLQNLISIEFKKSSKTAINVARILNILPPPPLEKEKLTSLKFSFIYQQTHLTWKDAIKRLHKWEKIHFKQHKKMPPSCFIWFYFPSLFLLCGIN